jgi:hypothetical protein
LIHSRLTAETLRRIVTLALTCTFGYGLRPIATPGLVSAAPGEHLNPRTDI